MLLDNVYADSTTQLLLQGFTKVILGLDFNMHLFVSLLKNLFRILSIFSTWTFMDIFSCFILGVFWSIFLFCCLRDSLSLRESMNELISHDLLVVFINVLAYFYKSFTSTITILLKYCWDSIEFLGVTIFLNAVYYFIVAIWFFTVTIFNYFNIWYFILPLLYYEEFFNYYSYLGLIYFS